MKIPQEVMVKALEERKILPYEEELVERLRGLTYRGFPLSIVLFCREFCRGECYSMSMNIYRGMDKFKLVHGDVNFIVLNDEYPNHSWVEKDGFVYDTTDGFRWDKDLYYELFQPVVREVYTEETVKDYEGYYNFYNIGSTPDPSIENGALINGARYAMWGLDPDEEEITDVEASLMLPWNSPERAITGGALWIASRYTAAGQDTLYFQKFDVIDNEDGLYQHQYAQNISMAYTEGARYYDGYEAIGMLDQPFTFLVPVYNNMPSSYGYLPEGDI
mgnify:CR=1 FL=1